MENPARRRGIPEWLILGGGVFFILVLTVSAIWQADIRWLHFFQAGLYVAIIVLGLRHSKWGYFLGIATAGTWAYINLFVTTFLRSGVRWLVLWARTGQLAHADQIIAIPAWLSNAVIVLGCLWAYGRGAEKRPGDLLRFVVAWLFATGFLALDIALFQPRYLPLFRGMLHPHLP